MRDHELRDRVLKLIETLKVQEKEHRAWATSYLNSGIQTEMVRHEALANNCAAQIQQLELLLREE